MIKVRTETRQVLTNKSSQSPLLHELWFRYCVRGILLGEWKKTKKCIWTCCILPKSYIVEFLNARKCKGYSVGRIKGNLVFPSSRTPVGRNGKTFNNWKNDWILDDHDFVCIEEVGSKTRKIKQCCRITEMQKKAKHGKITTRRLSLTWRDKEYPTQMSHTTSKIKLHPCGELEVMLNTRGIDVSLISATHFTSHLLKSKCIHYITQSIRTIRHGKEV